MNCCRLNCTWLAVLVGVLAGVTLGLLYGFGIVPIGFTFWAYLGIGVFGLLLTPIYATGVSCDGKCGCFPRYRTAILVGVVGTIVTAALGLILAPVAAVVTVAIVLGFATLFAVLFLATLVCLIECL